MSRFRIWIVLIAQFLLVVGCGGPAPSNRDDGRLQVVATTSIVADLVRNVGGERVHVTALMGPGVDPHLHKASQGDIATLNSAQIIFYNGLHLEGKMGDVLGRMASRKPTVAIADGIPPELLLAPPEFDGQFDPHVWFDATLWMRAATAVSTALAAADPDHRQEYERNAERYIAELSSLHEYAQAQLESIPPRQRVLVTAHDAFGYFGRAYGIEVLGLQGISTAAEFGLGDVQHLVGVLTERGIKAVFIESSVPKRAIEAVVEGARARGHEVSIGGELYSDALGDPDGPAGTYIGMFKHNVDTIVGALK